MSLFNWIFQWLCTIIISVGAFFLNAMANPFVTVRGRCHIFPGFTLRTAETITRVCLVVTMLLVSAGVIMMGYGPAQSAEIGPSTHEALTSAKSLTFDESVKLAIKQSPALLKGSVQIEISRMDETDSRYAMVPPITFRTYYYVNRPEGAGASRPYSLSFSTDPYNPFGSYFTLQAQKLATQVAILNHLATISQGLERLGVYYLQLDRIKKLMNYQKNMVNLDREILTFAENRMSIGTGTSLEVKVAQQELQLSQGELEQVAIVEKRTLDSLAKFLGLPPTAEFSPDLRDCPRQVLGNFDPATATVEQAKNRSYEIKTIDIQKKLQGYKILMAKAKVIPNILFNTQTPDPLSATTGYGLYVGFGLEIPVWDGFKRFRDISRQKAVLRQVDSLKEEKETTLENLWYNRYDDVQAKSMALKIAQSKEELARLKAHQNEVRYQSGEITLRVFLESRKQVLDAQKSTLTHSLDYNIAVLRLRELSGDLSHTYVDASSWQK